MSHGLSDIQLSSLRARAVAAKATAYCPYSKFRVGAAVLAADGTLTAGANVENAAYPVGTCAERVALARAVTERPGLVFSQQALQQQGEKEEEGKKGPVWQFKALAVATDSGTPASPCGMCRQL
ncbi:Cytidine deaminase-like protein [Moelleriella libera RCEF 2490]|uniref:Cytidine deaminase-like protein n=1 Tax=Moelleriella libera RCEF 2490 TaxID=1081109 RepID=A0A166UMF6_9HYPO|nr:Cytidine deaminase-like protein [Moelleriella libera RCEF 2490]